ncbi:hypothetical protein GOBAR_AA30641 [Gossypium barbadense]|uniref:SLC26A/SulP transporter domain-containing protein n=1 Tax=Gossypium barbadense TaxID=3634 RepID=A0A2P5WG19_GOSBA|nr:hypothetical protein GOBAR_AA30641 [Gossypium barbadense]
MGDLGTYIPIVLALTLAKKLNLGTTLIFTGIYSRHWCLIWCPNACPTHEIYCGRSYMRQYWFNIPEIMASGSCTGAILLVNSIVPRLIIAMSAVKYIRKVRDFSKSKYKGNRQWLGLDGMVLAIFCAGFITFFNGAGQERNQSEEAIVDEARKVRRKRMRKNMATIPLAFIIFLLGVVLAFIRRPKVVNDITFGPSVMDIVKITGHSWKEGFIKGTIPQLPLSVLNSVIAVCKLSSGIFPGREFSATSVSVTVGLLNLVRCWFGAMPCCHDAGGLAGQYKFGGRSGGCVALLGAAKMMLGLVLGTSLVTILHQFPVGILGVLLLFEGIELAMTCRDMNSKQESIVMLICTVVSLVGSSAALGFVCGMLVHVLLELRTLCMP